MKEVINHSQLKANVIALSANTRYQQNHIIVPVVTYDTEQGQETLREIKEIGVHCNNICIHLPGYRRGFCRWAENGNKTCITCYYQIPTNNIKCPCCRQIYRTRVHFAKRLYKIPKPAY